MGCLGQNAKNIPGRERPGGGRVAASHPDVQMPGPENLDWKRQAGQNLLLVPFPPVGLIGFSACNWALKPSISKRFFRLEPISDLRRPIALKHDRIF